MKTFIFLAIVLLLGNVYHSSVSAHTDNLEHRHDEGNEESIHYTQFYHEHDHHHHHHDHTYRGLRMTETSTLVGVGNLTYTTTQDLVQSGNHCGSKKP